MARSAWRSYCRQLVLALGASQEGQGAALNPLDSRLNAEGSILNFNLESMPSWLALPFNACLLRLNFTEGRNMTKSTLGYCQVLMAKRSGSGRRGNFGDHFNLSQTGKDVLKRHCNLALIQRYNSKEREEKPRALVVFEKGHAPKPSRLVEAGRSAGGAASRRSVPEDGEGLRLPSIT